MDFTKLDKIVNSPAIKEIQKMHNVIPKYNDLLQFRNISEVYNSPVIQIIQKQNTVWGGVLPFENTLKDIEAATLFRDFSPKLVSFQNQLSGISGPSIPADTNAIFTAFNKTGIFDAISSISRNMGALDTFNKITALSSLIEQNDYEVGISDNGAVFVDNEELSKAEIQEIVKEFISLPSDEVNLPLNVKK